MPDKQMAIQRAAALSNGDTAIRPIMLAVAGERLCRAAVGPPEALAECHRRGLGASVWCWRFRPYPWGRPCCRRLRR